MTKWMANNYFFVIKYILTGFHLPEVILKVKPYKLNDHKRAAKNTKKAMLKTGYHGYVIKITAETIKWHWIIQIQ